MTVKNIFKRHVRLRFASLATAILWASSLSAQAQTSTWDGGGPNLFWFTDHFENWNPSNTTPQGRNIVFSENGSVENAEATSNVVNQNATIRSLTYSLDSTTRYHVTEIVEGVKLTLAGEPDIFTIGGHYQATPTTTQTIIKGAGTFAIAQTGGIVFLGNNTDNNNRDQSSVLLDMRGLAVFEANLGATGAFNIGTDRPSETSTKQGSRTTLHLADKNTITAGVLRVSSVIIRGQRSLTDEDNPSNFYLGRENTLNIDSFHVGVGVNSAVNGYVAFDPSVSGSKSVVIRGSDGIGAVNEVIIGKNDGGGTSNSQYGVLDFSGGSVDALITNLVLGNAAGVVNGASGGIASGTLTMDEGTIDAAVVVVGQARGASTDHAEKAALGTININGGKFKAGSLTLALRSASAQMASGTLNIRNDGEVTAASGIVMGHRSGGAGEYGLTATVNIEGGKLAVSGDIAEGVGRSFISSTVILDGGTLNMGGNNIAVDVFEVKSGTLQDLGELLEDDAITAANLSKTTAGVLEIAGTNTYTGNTVVEAGTIHLTGSLGNGNVTVHKDAQFSLLSSGELRFNIISSSLFDQFLIHAGALADFEGALQFDLASDLEDGIWQLFVGGDEESFANLSEITLGGAFAGSFTKSGSLWTAEAGDRTFSFDADEGVLSIAVIPEPANVLLFFLGIGGIAFAQRVRPTSACRAKEQL